jgi:bifunctional DNase/RNase
MQTSDGSSMVLDSRPSDAIALALRVDCPIYVDMEVIQSSRSAPPSLQEEANDLEAGDDDWPDVIGEVGDLPM